MMPISYRTLLFTLGLALPSGLTIAAPPPAKAPFPAKKPAAHQKQPTAKHQGLMDLAHGIEQACQKLNSKTTGCPMARSAVEPEEPVSYPQSTLKGAYDQSLSLSVLTPEQAQKAFCQLLEEVDQKARNPVICAQRAMANAEALKSMGIEAGKAWATVPLWRKWSFGFANNSINPVIPGLENTNFDWTYHVANAVLVQTATGPKQYVIDPLLFPKGPVPIEEWTAILADSERSVPVEVKLSNAYALLPKDILNDAKDFRPTQLAEAKSILSMGHSEKRFGFVRFLPARPRLPETCPK